MEENKKIFDDAQDVVFKVSVSKMDRLAFEEIHLLAPYKYNDLGYLSLSWQYENLLNTNTYHYYGLITPHGLKEILGEKLWSEFLEGKRDFHVKHVFKIKNI